jgi:hypothetical protein
MNKKLEIMGNDRVLANFKPPFGWWWGWGETRTLAVKTDGPPDRYSKPGHSYHADAESLFLQNDGSIRLDGVTSQKLVIFPMLTITQQTNIMKCNKTNGKTDVTNGMRNGNSF